MAKAVFLRKVVSTALPRIAVCNEIKSTQVEWMKHYEVITAVIEHNNKFLCMQRSKAKFDKNKKCAV